VDHPTREEWMEFIYGEAEPADRARLEGHLKTCSDCREAADRWTGAMAGLDTWQVNVPARPKRHARVVAALAVAATVLIALGFAVGRLAAPGRADVQTLRAELEPALRASLEKELTAKWDASLTAAQETLRQDVMAQVRKEMDDAQAATNTLLAEYARAFDDVRRSDLVTLARLTEQELWRTKWQVAVALANAPYSAPVATTGPPAGNEHSSQ